MFNFFSRVAFPIAVVGEKFESEVYAEGSNWVEGRLFGSVYCCSKIKCSVSEDKVGLSSDSVYASFLVVSNADGNFQSSFESKDRSILQSFPAKYSLVINHSPMRFECALFSFVSFVDFNNFAYGSNGHLCAKPVLFSDSIIDFMVEFPFVGDFVFKGNFGDVVTCFIGLLHGTQKASILFLCWCEFYEKRQLQLNQYMECFFPYLNVSPIPPMNKFKGFLGGLLYEKGEI